MTVNKKWRTAGCLSAAFLAAAVPAERLSEYLYRYAAADNTDKTQSVEAAAVFTGGSERLAAGFELCRAGKIKNLLVTGVFPDEDVNAVLTQAGYSDLAQTAPCKITWGRRAVNTVGNAVETRDWLEENKIRSFFLITSAYHMPRSQVNMNHYLPRGVKAVPYAVKLPKMPFSEKIEPYVRDFAKFAVMPFYNPVKLRPA